MNSNEINRDGNDYCLYTLNAPIAGIEEDIDAFIGAFVERGSPRFSDFAELWKTNVFLHLMYGRQIQTALKDILECIFYHAVQKVVSHDTSDLGKIGALYIIYAFFGKQPINKQARINVTPRIWKSFIALSESLTRAEQWDAYFIFRQLCVKSAFRFVAVEEELYPGAPLYCRSDVTLPSRLCFLTKSQRRRLHRTNSDGKEDANSVDNLPTRLRDLSTHLKTNLPAISTAISRYVEAKRDITRSLDSSACTDPNFEDESFLMSLNLVNYPESVAPLTDLAKKFAIDSQEQGNAVEGGTSSKPDDAVDDIAKRRKQLRHAEKWSAASAGSGTTDRRTKK